MPVALPIAHARRGTAQWFARFSGYQGDGRTAKRDPARRLGVACKLDPSFQSITPATQAAASAPAPIPNTAAAAECPTTAGFESGRIEMRRARGRQYRHSKAGPRHRCSPAAAFGTLVASRRASAARAHRGRPAEQQGDARLSGARHGWMRPVRPGTARGGKFLAQFLDAGRRD